ncbi:hypothetical protein C0995_014624 [Termitomyces sp. Mi166|nr:hypothetical protein C0995_014624 [Termitomyces sp. Mi166\
MMSLSLPSPSSPSSPNPLTSLLTKYDTALSLYDDLAKDISQMRKATQLVRQKTLRLFETKVRRKKALEIQSEALDVLLAAGVKAQQRRKGTGPRKARRRDSTASTKPKSPVKRGGSTAGTAGTVVSPKVHFELPGVQRGGTNLIGGGLIFCVAAVPVRSVHTMSTRRSAKKIF